MPTSYIKKLASEGYGSISELEKKWAQAKKIAASENHKVDYKYIVGIFKKLVKIQECESMQINEELTLTPRDKKVIQAFVNRSPDSNKKFHTDGEVLDGSWMGGNRLAYWEGDKIRIPDVGSRSAQTVSRYISKLTKLIHEGACAMKFRDFLTENEFADNSQMKDTLIEGAQAEYPLSYLLRLKSILKVSPWRTAILEADPDFKSDIDAVIKDVERLESKLEELIGEAQRAGADLY